MRAHTRRGLGRRRWAGVARQPPAALWTRPTAFV